MKQPQANFAFLLAGLVLMLVGTPIVEDLSDDLGRADQSLVNLLFGATLLLGVWTLLRHERHFYVGLVLTGITCAATAAAMLGMGEGFHLLAMGSMLLFFAVAIELATRQVLATREVDANAMMGAICIYLMVGLIFTLLYAFAALGIDGAFHGIDIHAADYRLSNLVYFSFVTLTTLGYGDVSPLHHIPRNLAILEAIVGQFYLAILVAGMVGLRIANRSAGGSAD